MPGDRAATLPVAVVVVNWNGWRDTLVCLESLLALGGAPMRVVVCDNASTDASVEEIGRYLRERLPGWLPAPGSPGYADPHAAAGVLSVHLLPLPANAGYAGGLNAGIRWAGERWNLRGFWLLNNDVQAEPRALDALLAAHASVPGAGICGSVLLEWDEPERIQAVAGVFRRWLGVGWHRTDPHADGGPVSLAVDYPVGASMYVSPEYLEKVGPMDASYFLYCEEMDWAERGRRLGYRPLVALQSRLRHKEGASTGSRGGVRHKSLLSERYGVINRLRITRKFWPQWLPVVWCSLAAVVLDRVAHGEIARARLVLRLMFSPSSWWRGEDRRPSTLNAIRRAVSRRAWSAARVVARASSARRLRRLRQDLGELLRIEPVFVARDRDGFFAGWNSKGWREASNRLLASDPAHGPREFRLRRFCLCCNEATPMLVGYLPSPAGAASVAPNWREWLVCSDCGMNNRQRLVAKLVQQFARQSSRPAIYLMEQVTPMYEWVRRLPGTQVHGSEYLGHEYRGGMEVRGVRHEDVTSLSYADGSFDLIVSNDVLEHVPDPEAALRECFRVLKPGGHMLATFPFHVGQDDTVARARLAGSRVEHVLPAQYHGNPVSADGSLVFHDFGWSWLDVMERLGFSAAVEAYWSDEFGHLGDVVLVFRLARPLTAAG